MIKLFIMASLEFSPLQYVLAGIVTLFLIASLIIFIIFLIKLIKKTEAEKEREKAEEKYKEKIKEIEKERRELERALKKAEKVSDNASSRLEKEQAEMNQMEQELIATGLDAEEAKKYASMSLLQLLKLKNKDNTNIPGDFIVNAITRRITFDYNGEVREDLDFIVPIAKTKNFSLADIEKCIQSFEGIEKFENKNGTTYKMEGKSFVMVNAKENHKYRLTLKVGNHYADKLRAVLPETIIKAKFPAGLFWYNVENDEECSLEIAKLLIEISYNIAKAGY